jgi:hypothetical protein
MNGKLVDATLFESHLLLQRCPATWIIFRKIRLRVLPWFHVSPVKSGADSSRGALCSTGSGFPAAFLKKRRKQ